MPLQHLGTFLFFGRSPYLLVVQLPVAVFVLRWAAPNPVLPKIFFENEHAPVQGWATPNILFPDAEVLPTGMGYAHTYTPIPINTPEKGQLHLQRVSK